MLQHQDIEYPPPARQANASHIPGLDGLRGVAILLVLVHMLNLLEAEHGMPAWVFSRISQIGWTGVQLFFVLSGFLITGILLDTQRSKKYFSAFYGRRTLRIFPLYFSVLTLAFVILPWLGSVPPSVATDQHHQIWLWTYLSNWAAIFDQGSKAFPHFWSLAVEEQFYLVWPLLVRSRSTEQCLRFCLGVAALALALRCVLAGAGVSDDLIYENSFCRMDALALGGAAAAAVRIPAWNARLLAMHDRCLVWAGMLGLFGLLVTRGFWTGTLVGITVGYTIVALTGTLLLIAIVGAEASGGSGWVRIFRWRPLRAMGKYSYAIYIFHKPLHDLAGKPLLKALRIDVSQSVVWSAAYMAVAIACSFLLAFCSWHLLEKRFLRMKRFFVAS